MGWNARKYVPWMIIGFFVSSMVCVKLVAAQDAPFVIGLDQNPPKLDPQDQYDSESQKLIGQVCEGLLRYNYTSPEMESIPQLATGIGSFEGNNIIGYNYTVTLRNDVTFHDGTPFNASAVKWTFDRIQYFSYGIYENGVLVAKSAELMESYPIFALSGIPILNSTVIESEFIVRFVLNTTPGFFERLLAFMATQIMLPDEGYIRGPKFSGFLGVNDLLIGTGPFELVEYEYDSQVVFKAYEDYYLPRPEGYIQNMIYLIFQDTETLYDAYCNNEVHWHEKTVYVYAEGDCERDPYKIGIEVPSLTVFFIQMNVTLVPQAVRKASAFAFNYTNLINDRYNVLSLHTPIPLGMCYYNEGFPDEPYTNLTYARELIVNCPELSVNITTTDLAIENSTEEWRLVADSSNPLAWYNFIGYSGLEYYYNKLADDLKNIGIRLDFYIENTCDCSIVCDPWCIPSPEEVAYTMGGWAPKFYDPINMIEPLYHSNGNYNKFSLNDSELDDLLYETYFTSESTTPTREELFFEIQEKIVTELVPSFYLFQRLGFIYFNRKYVNETSITDLRNSCGDYYWFNVKFHPPKLDGLGSVTIALIVIGGICVIGLTLYLIRVKFMDNKRGHP